MLPTSGPALPATYGGPGAIHRAQTHEEDVQRGLIWATVGQRDEWGRLRRCALPEAPASLDAVIDPEAAWMLRRPDRAQIQRELDALAALFDRLGVEVWTVPAARAAQPAGPARPAASRCCNCCNTTATAATQLQLLQHHGPARPAATALARRPGRASRDGLPARRARPARRRRRRPRRPGSAPRAAPAARPLGS